MADTTDDAGMGTQAPSWLETTERAIISAIPVIGGPLSVLYEDLASRRRARLNEFEERVDQLVDPPIASRSDLSAETDRIIIDAAVAFADTDYEAKKELLARVTANAVNDPAEIDRSRQIIATISSLDTEHVAVLARLSKDFYIDIGKSRTRPSRPWKGVSRKYLEETVGPLLVETLTDAKVIGEARGPRESRSFESRMKKVIAERNPRVAMVWVILGVVGSDLLGLIRSSASHAFGGSTVDVTEWGREILLELGDLPDTVEGTQSR